MGRRTLLLAAALCAPAALSAQAARATFIDWGNVTASVYSDTAFGVQLWIGTSHRTVHAGTHSVSLSFAPDSIYPWADGAALVITPTRPPHDSIRILATPPLRALDGTIVRMLRRAAGNAWEKRVVLSFELADSTLAPLNIAARPWEARAFIDAVYRNATVSGVIADSVDLHAGPIETPCKAPVIPPSVVDPGRPQYPATRVASGRVLLEFVVGPDGHVDRRTIRPIAATDAVFISPSIEAVLRTGFSPGRCDGEPAPVVVRQAVNFGR